MKQYGLISAALLAALCALAFVVIFFTTATPDASETPPAASESVIASLGDDTERTDYAEARMLARIMQDEDGVDWPDWAIMAIGQVVLNRVASDEWPDTVYDVLTQKNQYEPVITDGAWFSKAVDDYYLDLAYRLLDGETVLPESVVYQALFPQGTVTVVTVYDPALDTTTYFCE